MNPDLEVLENEAIHIIRMAYSWASNPVLLYSTGKDSTVLLDLIKKAFEPKPIPFPMLHIDSTFKFREMREFRDRMVRKYKVKCIVHVNEEGRRNGVTPWGSGSFTYTNIMKTEALRQALNRGNYDIILGGARREEERVRAKERVFSVRNMWHQWEPKRQRIEMWDCYNGGLQTGDTLRIFPLSNWTELDIWEYIRKENLEVVPLYFAKERPCVKREGMWIVRDDDRMPLLPGEEEEMKLVRFRTLGCYPLTAAIESEADTIDKIIDEVKKTEYSERSTRLIDKDSPKGDTSSMEWKKVQGYF